jgi:nucleotide-binding universal stress UspA family protein
MPIVCGTDLSDGGAEAIAAAVALASLRGDREVLVVHVIGEDEAEDDAARDRLEKAALSKLDAAAASALAGFLISIKKMVLFASPVAGLISVADTEGSDLIVVAAQATPSASLIKLGSTAERIVAAAAVPVLLVRTAASLVAWARSERPLKALIAIDESATCDAAIGLVKRMRERSAIDVVLGTVYYADEAARHFGLIAESAVDAHPEVERLLKRDLLRRFGVSTGAGAITAKPMHGLGRIGDHVLELADVENVDVIVVGTHQKTGLGRLGSVSAVIAHGARQNVLCVPPTSQVGRPDVPTIQTTVVATDLSAFGNRAVPYGYSLAGAAGEVHIVHIREDQPEDRVGLEAQLLALTPTGATSRTRAHILIGDDPAELIAETAARVGADVICIASHGRSGITRALVGSVADRLLRQTRLPVLVLRPKS